MIRQYAQTAAKVLVAVSMLSLVLVVVLSVANASESTVGPFVSIFVVSSLLTMAAWVISHR
jgi:predicted Na+-dependent transporter